MTLKRVITLAVIALLVFIGYQFIAWQLVLEMWGMGAAVASMIFLLAINGGWIWALLVSMNGSLGGIKAGLVFSLVPVILAASDLLVFCPSPCQGYWPLAEILHWVTLLSGLLAAGSTVAYLRSSTS